MESHSEKPVTPEFGSSLFAMQVRLSPELLEAVITLSDSNPGILNGIIATMGEAISDDPMAETTIERIHDVLGIPEDDSQLPEWRMNFWDAFKNRSSSE